MALSPTDVKRLLQACFPAGSENLYDWDNPAANVGQFFVAWSNVLKTYGTDLVDQLRQEVSPLTVVQKIPEWEVALGLSETPVAKFGTPVQRRNAILAWLRQSGGMTPDDYRALVQPFFLYQDPSQIEIIEVPRNQLNIQHSYGNSTLLNVLGGASGTSTVQVLDDPYVSVGLQLLLNMVCDPSQPDLVIIGPDGTQVDFPPGYLGQPGAVAPHSFLLHTPWPKKRPIYGTWTLKVNSGAAATIVSSWTLIVEGIGRNYDGMGNPNGQGLGAKIFEWAVLADPAQLGTGFDLQAALRALQRAKPAHTQAFLAIKPTAGGDPTIYDDPNAIYDACLFG